MAVKFVHLDNELTQQWVSAFLLMLDHRMICGIKIKRVIFVGKAGGLNETIFTLQLDYNKLTLLVS